MENDRTDWTACIESWQHYTLIVNHPPIARRSSDSPTDSKKILNKRPSLSSIPTPNTIPKPAFTRKTETQEWNPRDSPCYKPLSQPLSLSPCPPILSLFRKKVNMRKDRDPQKARIGLVHK